MRDLVIHIGLPKTATTFVQRLMAEKANYIGLESKNSSYTRELVKLFRDYSKGKDVDNAITIWSSYLVDFLEENNIQSPIVISSEFFFASEFNNVPEFPLVEDGSSYGEPMIAKFIKKLSEILNYKFSLKILLTIRNQSEWLASKYAQASPKIYGASQEDFERRIVLFSKLSNRFWCDWGGLVKILDQQVGENNVFILCMEDIDKGEFWEKLSLLFMGSARELEPESYLVSDRKHVNNKRKNSVEWHLGKFQFGAFLAKKYRIAPTSYIHRVVVNSGNALMKLGFGRDSGRDEVINLSSIIVHSCNNNCNQGNVWLEQRLDKDLSSLGYPKIQSRN